LLTNLELARASARGFQKRQRVYQTPIRRPRRIEWVLADGAAACSRRRARMLDSKAASKLLEEARWRLSRKNGAKKMGALLKAEIGYSAPEL